MKKQKGRFRTQTATAVMLIAAVGLLAFAGIGGVRAAWKYSEAYKAEVSMKHIGVTLLENGTPAAERNYEFDKETGESTWTAGASGVLSFASEDASMHTIAKDRETYQGRAPILDKKYDETLEVQNSGTIDEYVRVSIYRYWLDENGKKQTDLSPALIELYQGETNLDEASAIEGWVKDSGADTEERMVLYYQSLLPVEGITSPVFDHVAISNEIATVVDQEKGGNTITTTYKYDGCQFCLEVTADAVQSHHAAEAIRNAWGADPSLAGQAVSE